MYQFAEIKAQALAQAFCAKTPYNHAKYPTEIHHGRLLNQTTLIKCKYPNLMMKNKESQFTTKAHKI